MRTILFVCTGNTCRSPMAEAIARHWLAEGGGDEEVFVASAGVFAAGGMPTTTETLTALARHGIEHEGRSKPLTAEMVRKADIVFCMTADHQEAARALVEPVDHARVLRIDDDRDIDDPIGEGQEAYDQVCRRLLEIIPHRLKEALTS